jgi:hypothetical protein
MSWQWYKQVVLPEATTTMVVQDFVDLWARHQKDFWDASTDFPDLTPRLPRMFLIAAAPKKFRTGVFGQQPWPRSSPRRWGVFFEAALTAEIWSDAQMVPLISLEGPQPDEFVLRGAEAKRLARWWVVASLMEERRSAGDSKAVGTAVWSYMVDENGSIPVVGGMRWSDLGVATSNRSTSPRIVCNTLSRCCLQSQPGMRARQYSLIGSFRPFSS